MPLVALERGTRTPLTRQIYERLRAQILTGALSSGFRMVSTRHLAGELGVSRNIVVNAFEQLLAEGYLEARVGAGTFVSSGARFKTRTLPELPEIPSVGFRPFQSGLIDFRSGLPDLSRFPVRTWDMLSRQVWAGLAPQDLGYSQPEGRPELRKEIAAYIAAYRGVRCHPDQVLITGGTTQAVGIISRLLLGSRTRTCILEDPVTSDIQSITAGLGAKYSGCRLTGRECAWMACRRTPSPPSFTRPRPTSFPLA